MIWKYVKTLVFEHACYTDSSYKIIVERDIGNFNCNTKNIILCHQIHKQDIRKNWQKEIT